MGYRKTWDTTKSAAKWIWLAGLKKPANAYVDFRTSFTLPDKPKKALLRVSADCKYLLWVNGVYCGRGPLTVETPYKQFDGYDCAKLLRRGTNVLAALVLHRQNKTSRLIPVRGGFILELTIAGVVIATSAAWKARRAVEYKEDTPYMTHQYGQQEWVDGRVAEPGWEEDTAFDDAHWQNASVVEDAQSHWPAALEARTVFYMARIKKNPACLVSFLDIACGYFQPEKETEPARQIELDYAGSSVFVHNPEGIADPKKGPAVFVTRAGGGVGIVVDMGGEVYGYPYVDFECPAGVTVDIGHGEAISRNRVQTVLIPGSTNPQCYGDRYISREGRQRFELFDTKGFRYLELHFRRLSQPGTEGKVVIHDVGVMQSAAPVKRASSFECSDPRLNEIWSICKRTAEIIHQDWHICDAQREQNNWPECFQDFVLMQTYGTSELIRSMITMFARGQLKEGFILCTIPPMCKPEPEYLYLLSTVYFPLLIAMDRLYGGDDERQRGLLDTMRRVFDGLFRYADREGVPVSLPGINWVEWSAMDIGPMNCKEWQVTAIIATIVITLEHAARYADDFGEASLAAEWRARAGRIRAVADKRYWSDRKQAYIDGVYDGKQSESVSQTANSFAVLAGFGTMARRRIAMRTIMNPEECDVPCTTHTMAILHQAMETLDMDIPVLTMIRRIWGKMISLGATTTWESEEALERHMGCCFGFSSHPLNYFVRNLLGVIPVKAGYKIFRVEITPLDIESAKGNIATPAGYIAVDWNIKNKKLHLHLTVPKGTTALIAALRFPRGAKRVVTGKTIVIDGKKALLTSRTIPACMFTDKQAPVVEVRTGRHTIVFG